MDLVSRFTASETVYLVLLVPNGNDFDAYLVKGTAQADGTVQVTMTNLLPILSGKTFVALVIGKRLVRSAWQ